MSLRKLLYEPLYTANPFIFKMVRMRGLEPPRSFPH
jgi:hypothetical protein